MRNQLQHFYHETHFSIHVSPTSQALRLKSRNSFHCVKVMCSFLWGISASVFFMCFAWMSTPDKKSLSCKLCTALANRFLWLSTYFCIINLVSFIFSFLFHNEKCCTFLRIFVLVATTNCSLFTEYYYNLHVILFWKLVHTCAKKLHADFTL